MSALAQGNRSWRPEADLRSWWRWGLVVATLVPVFLATLVPSGSNNVVTSFLVCLVCGEFGTANLIRNVVLFVPLGAALGLLLGPGRWALLAVFVVTATIETLQFHVPGRNPMVVDLGANFLGGALSIVAVRTAPLWLATRRSVSAATSLGVAFLSAGIFMVTAALFSTHLPESTWWGQWTPNLGHLERYDGRVLQATLGDHPVGPRRMEDSGRARSALEAGAPVGVLVEAGTPTPGLAPVFSVFDEARREILLLGVDGADLVGRVRLRANDWRLDRPDLRVPKAFVDVAPGDTVFLELTAAGGRSCLSLNEDRWCGIGLRIEEGWALLRFPRGVPEWFRRLLDLGWSAALFAPFGYFLRSHRLSLLGGLVLAGALLSPWWLSSVAGPSVTSFLGAGAGVVVGLVGARSVRSRWPVRETFR